jgi:hypothetical protein
VQIEAADLDPLASRGPAGEGAIHGGPSYTGRARQVRCGVGGPALRDVDATPLSAFRVRPAKPGEPGGLILGYAAYAPREIDDACARLAAALRAASRRTD